MRFKAVIHHEPTGGNRGVAPAPVVQLRGARGLILTWFSGVLLCLSAAGAEVESPPVIGGLLVEPTNHTPVIGGTATFTVEASGTTPLFFQWEFKDSPIPGATDALLSLSPLRSEDAGTYRVVVSNRLGVAFSSRANLNPATWVIWGNEIIQNKGLPASATNLVAVSAWESHTIGLRADGTVVVWPNSDGFDYAGLLPPAGLQEVAAVAAGPGYNLALLADGTLRAWGWNAPALAIPPGTRDVVAIAAGHQFCLAIRSDGKLLVFGDNPEVRRQAEGIDDAVGVTAYIRWGTARRSDGSVVNLGLNPYSSFEPPFLPPPVGVPPLAAVSAAYGHGIGLIDDGPPRVFQQPRSFDGIIGANARLVVNAIGGQPLRYQWRVNGFDLLDATNSVLALDGLSFFDTGEYDVVVSNERGSVTSELAGITVRVSPPFNVQLQVEPATGAALLGGSALFSAHAEGTQPFAYQWLHDGQPISNSREAVLRLDALKFADGGDYSVVVANPFGTSTSAPVRLTVVEIAAWGSNSGHALDVPASATNVIGVAAGSQHSVALRADGTVVVWGNLPVGGGMWPGGALQPPNNLSNVVAVAAGGYFNVALKSDGRLVGWGDNSWGQLSGLSQLSNIVAVAADYAHVLALRADGTVYARGGNFSGQIDIPAGLDGVIAIAAGWESSMALRSDGSLVQWGTGQKVSGADGLHDIVAIAPGLALREDGSLLGWFDESPGAPALVAISGSRDRRLLLRADGTVSSADSPAGLSNVVAIAAGFLHSLALVGGGPPRIIQQPLSFTAAYGRNARLVVTASGTQPIRYQWRQNGHVIDGATRPVLALDNLSFFDAADYDVIVSNALGSSTSRVATTSVTFQPPSEVAIHIEPTNGVAFLGGSALMTASSGGSPPFGYQWRFQDSSILSARGSTLRLEALTFADSGIYSVAVANPFGSSTSAPVQLSIVQVAAWGGRNVGSDNRVFNVPPSVTNAIAVSASQWHVLALRPDGTVVGWGDPYGGKLPAPATATNLVSIAAGGEFSLGLRTDGTVLVWGDQANNYGIRNLPQGLTNVVQLSAAYSWALALKASGTVEQWGTYIGGSMKPPPIGLTNVIQISAGARHALGLLRNGTVVGWGSDDCDQVNPPTTLSNVVQIVAGNCYSMALREDGTVVEWGRETYSPPPDATNLVAIATGNFHRIGLRDDGKVFSWGFENGNAGQTRVPSDFPPVIAIAAAGDASFGIIPATREPHLARQPRRQTLFTGQSLRLEASFFPGSAPVTYQWFQNGMELPSQTNAVLEIPSVKLADAGRYSIRASNAFGTDTSREAEVTVVEQAPVIVAQPADVMTFLGGPASFSVAVTGTVPLMFRWFFNDAPLPGATNASLVFQQVSGTNAGVYHAVISNALGTAISRSVELRLAPAIFLAQTEVPVNSSGRFNFKVHVSEPLAREVRLQFVYSHGAPWEGNAVREAFAVVAPSAIEQCVAIQDADLAQALAGGFSGVLRLVVADGAVVASPAEAVFRVAGVGDLMCETVSIEPPRFIPGGFQKRPDGAVELIFSADTQRPFSVQASTDLQNWWAVTGVFAVDPVGGHIWFLDRDASNAPMRFYRIHSE